MGSGKPDANDLDEYISEMLMHYEKNLASLTNQLERVIEKIECLTDELQKLSEKINKAKKDSG